MTNKKIAPFFAAEVPLWLGRSGTSAWSKGHFKAAKVPLRPSQSSPSALFTRAS